MDKLKQKDPQLIQLCSRCGKRVEAAKGSMTAWLFRESRCSCPPSARGEISATQANVKSEPLPQIDTRHTIIELIGEGGMGSVYKAHENASGKLVAIKILRSSLVTDQRAISRFEHEAKASLGLDQPGLVKVLNYGVNKDNLPYLIMDFVEGKSLDKVLAELRSMEREPAIELLEQLCDALAYLHERHIVHRDLKPSNIILLNTASGLQAKIVDFGIAKVCDDVGMSASNQLTQTGELIGSPPYMSPEQCMGHCLDQRSDIYSLGCVMHHVLSGNPPFDGGNPVQIIVKHLHEAPPKLAITETITREISEIVSRCLCKDLSERYQTVGEIKDDLQRLKDGKPISKRNFSWGAFLKRQTGKITIAGTIVLFVCAAGMFYFQHPQIDSDKQWHLLDSEGQQLFDRGKLRESQQVFLKSLEVSERAGKDFKLASLNELLDLSRADNQLEMVKKHLAEINKFAGVDDLVCNLQNEIDLELNNNKELVSDHESRLRLRRLCDETNDIAASLNKSGNSSVSEKLLTACSKLCVTALGAEDPIMIRCLHNLSNIYHDRGEYKKAAEGYEKSLALQRKLTPGDPLMARTLLLLGRANFQSGAPISASEKLLEESLDINRKIYGPSSPELAFSRYQLASLYAHFDKMKDAKDQLRTAITLYEHSATPDNNRLAACYGLLGWITRNEELCLKALHLYESQITKDYSGLCECLVQLASLSANKNPQESLAYLQRAEAIVQRFEDSKKIAFSYNIYQSKAFAQRKMDNFKKAKVAYESALSCAGKVYGRTSPQFLEATAGLASLLVESNEQSAAESLYMNVCNNFELNSSAKIKAADAIYRGYSRLLNQQHRFSEAKVLDEKWKAMAK